MAIADLIGKLFAARYLSGVTQSTPYLLFADDRSAEVESGDGVVMGVGNLGVQVGDYPASGAITYRTISPGAVTLSVDKEKYVAFSVEDTNNARTRVNLVSEAANEASRVIRKQVESDIRSMLVAATPTETFAVSTAKADATTKAERIRTAQGIIDMVESVKAAGYTQRPVLFLDRMMGKVMTQYITQDDALNVALVDQVRSVFINGALSTLFGADVVVDYGFTVDQDAATTAVEAVMVIPNRTIAYAQQLTVPEIMRSDSRFATNYRALMTYGSAIQDADALWHMTVTPAA